MKLLRDARKLLLASGLPHEVVEGTKHHEVFICGKRVLVLARSSRDRNLHALESAIRRAAEAIL